MDSVQRFCAQPTASDPFGRPADIAGRARPTAARRRRRASRILPVVFTASTMMLATACGTIHFGSNPNSSPTITQSSTSTPGEGTPSSISTPAVPTPTALTAQQIRAEMSAGTVAIRGTVSDGYIGGTGFVVDKANGYVVTNAHVIQGATAFTVRFSDNTETSARVVARASCDDLAILKLASVPASVQALPLGDSDAVASADTVYALGYPASFQDFETEKPAFTSGLVQTANVPANPDASLPTYAQTIQHSAVINPGNSGGPLVNALGQVVGINTLSNYGTASQAVQGQFYSISIDHAKPIMEQLEHGHNSDYIGGTFTPLSELDLTDLYVSPAAAKDFRAYFTSNGIDGLVVNATPDPGSPLDAKFEAGDLITNAQGAPVTSISDLCAVLESTSPGGRIRLQGMYIYDIPKGATFGEGWTTEITLPRN